MSIKRFWKNNMRKKLTHLTNKFIKHELVSGSFYLFVGTTIANFFAFLFNLFMTRMLATSDYGIYVSLLSVITLMTVPIQSLGPVIVKFAAGYFAKDELGKGVKLYVQMYKFVFISAILLFAGFVIFSSPIKDFLRIQNVWYVVLSALVVSLYYINLVNSAFIQSLLKFRFLAFLSVLNALIRLVSGILLVFMGLRIFGALGGLFTMAIIGFFLSFLPLRFMFKNIKDNKAKIPIREIISYALPTAFSIFFLTSFTSIDVILVKHFFNPHQAGLYAGLSLVGKVIFYFTGPIPLVMFPLLINRHSLGKSFNNLFYLALLLVLLPSVAITVFYFLFPSFVVRLFLGGGDYLSIIPYLGFFGIYLSVFSFVNVCVNFFLSINKMKVVPMVVIASFFQIMLIFIFHKSFYQIIGVSLFVCLMLLLLLLFYYVLQYGKLKKIPDAAFVESGPAI